MKYLGLILSWTVAIGFAFSCTTISLIQADPSDDFSFSLAHAPETNMYKLMTEQRVAEILADHLDLFPRSQTAKLSRHLLSLCRRYRFDPAFVLSLIQVESGFRTRVVSPAGAVGLMQLMPGTANRVLKEWGVLNGGRAVIAAGYPAGQAITERALVDPYLNLSIGVAYLAFLRDRYQGLSPYYLVAAYNIGPMKMDELMSHKSFKPVKTKKYFDDIRRGVPKLRFYRRLIGRREI